MFLRDRNSTFLFSFLSHARITFSFFVPAGHSERERKRKGIEFLSLFPFWPATLRTGQPLRGKGKRKCAQRNFVHSLRTAISFFSLYLFVFHGHKHIITREQVAVKQKDNREKEIRFRVYATFSGTHNNKCQRMNRISTVTIVP